MKRHILLLSTILLSIVAYAQPTDNPYKTKYGTAPIWTNDIRWDKTVNILDFEVSGQSFWDAALTAAMTAVSTSGGGVVYFPAGTYAFADNVTLPTAVVLRGEMPAFNNAKVDSFAPPARLVFPKYEPTFVGDGTPNSTAFKSISGSGIKNAGLVHLDINRGRVYLGGSSRNILVFGIRLNNIAQPHTDIPSNFSYMAGWQRFSYRHCSTITIYVSENGAIVNSRFHDLMNNLYHPITDDSYPQPQYVVTGRYKTSRITPTGVLASEVIGGVTVDTTHIEHGERAKFDYLAHYGISISGAFIDPATLPKRINQQIEVVDNWIYNTMRVAIFAQGIGVKINGNITRDLQDKRIFIDPTGVKLVSNNSATYENRSLNFAGDNITIERNDLRVYRHKILYTNYSSVDGEGILMQTQDKWGAWMDGINVLNNKLNSYIGFYDLNFDQRNLNISGNNLMNLGNIFIFKKNIAFRLDNVFVENNDSVNSILVGNKATADSYQTIGNNLFIRNNKGIGSLKYPCQSVVSGNTGFTNTVNTCPDDFNVLLAVTPSFGQQAVSKNAEISVTYPHLLSAIDLSGITLVGETAGNLAITATIQGQKLVITHSGNILPNQKYTVTIPAGSVKSASNSVANTELSWWYITQARPYYQTITPGKAATGISNFTPIQIQWANPITISDASKIKILDASNELVTGLTLLLDANTNILTILHDPFVPNSIYKVIIDADAVANADLFGNELTEWSFTTGSAAITSVEKIGTDNFKLAIFPNPASSYISIQLPNKSSVSALKVFNSTGAFIHSVDVLPSQSIINMNVSNYQKGMYFIVPFGNSNQQAAKFFKK